MEHEAATHGALSAMHGAGYGWHERACGHASDDQNKIRSMGCAAAGAQSTLQTDTQTHTTDTHTYLEVGFAQDALGLLRRCVVVELSEAKATRLVGLLVQD